jgi:hypothetical protein
MCRVEVGNEEDQELMNEITKQNEADEQDVITATNHLFQVTLPQCAHALHALISDLSTSSQRDVFLTDWLVPFVHFHGLNLRHLGNFSSTRSLSTHSLSLSLSLTLTFCFSQLVF